MKTDNVFKFVAIRAPQKIEETRRVVKNPEGGTYIVEIRKRRRENQSFDEAKREFAAECIKSDQYFKRNSGWKMFLKIQGLLKELIIDLRKERNGRKIRKELEEFFRKYIDEKFDIEDFAKSNFSSFTVMRRQLWKNYYCNLILSRVRPEDRSDIVFWLRVFTLLENIENENELEWYVQNFNKIRLSVPFQLFVSGKANFENNALNKIEEEKKQADEETMNQIQEKQNAIEKFRSIKEKINKIVEKNTGEIEKQDIEDEDKDINDEVVVRNPWILRKMDFEDDSLEIFKQKNISIEGIEATETLEKLDAIIAQEYYEIHRLQHVEEVVFVNGIPVKRRLKRY